MQIVNWLMILVVLLGPIVAVQVQKFIEIGREKKGQRLYIFKTLMATRGSPISGAHVEALNMIDLVFYGKNKRDKKIVDKWKEYLDHLCNAPQDRAAGDYTASFKLWLGKNGDYLTDLLFEMAQSLGFEYDKVTLKKGVYVPKGHNDLEMEQQILRWQLLDVFGGQRRIHVEIHDSESQEKLPRPAIVA